MSKTILISSIVSKWNCERLYPIDSGEYDETDKELNLSDELIEYIKLIYSISSIDSGIFLEHICKNSFSERNCNLDKCEIENEFLGFIPFHVSENVIFNDIASNSFKSKYIEEIKEMWNNLGFKENISYTNSSWKYEYNDIKFIGKADIVNNENIIELKVSSTSRNANTALCQLLSYASLATLNEQKINKLYYVNLYKNVYCVKYFTWDKEQCKLWLNILKDDYK